MGLLKPAKNQTAFAKIGILGFTASGKTFTGTQIAIGLTKLSKSKQFAFFDTEKGSDFLIKSAQKAGIEMLVHRGRAFKDLLTIIREVQDAKIPVLLIDSITHVWRDLCDSYSQKYNKKRLHMGDWGVLKGQWKEYTDLYINSPIHIIMLGRAGYEYDFQENEETGKQEVYKSGIKMKVEGETGFEPDLLLEMERIQEKDKIINRCWVLKDRNQELNGKSIDYPSFESFTSFWKFLNLGGEHKGIDTTRTSEDVFADPDWSYAEIQKRKEIALDEIRALFIKAGLDGSSAEAKKKRVETLERVFSTPSWTAIEHMKVPQLEMFLGKLKIDLGFEKDQTKIGDKEL